MEIHIKKADAADVESILNNRVEFLNEVTGVHTPEDFQKATKENLLNHLGNNSVLCYFAESDHRIVSSVILCLYTVIPKPSNFTGKIGYIFNVYTIREFRQKGLATTLLKKAIEEAKQLGVEELYLDATDEGKRVYEKLRFQHLDREMHLFLKES